MVPADLDRIEGVNDSKKLSEATREVVAARIGKTDGVRWCTTWVSSTSIDSGGISAALKGAFSSAVQTLLGEVEEGSKVEVRIDGSPIRGLWIKAPVQFIIKGDVHDWRIGAASIVAKVERDRLMVDLAQQHPAYGWERNKGYGSQDHQEAIRKYGLTPLHRATFCRRFVEQEDNVLDLFA